MIERNGQFVVAVAFDNAADARKFEETTQRHGGVYGDPYAGILRARLTPVSSTVTNISRGPVGPGATHIQTGDVRGGINVSNQRRGFWTEEED